ncbi:Crp/Fnr family transcriptional regulator [Hahella sp. CCB-MM4]|uniref:Crp/Fnr family transcriptional regulator n=1 Tax=Hahella sp. (strain CCB-MM4) TaxID=1926491 RepID=UPI000B9B6164|nr:Crp/Fnr family transcriptional regulator [Hahella sp. CCB-MM4]OZG74506.1 Crp/Fnr family transcriptional regulator [Hahella sp. CCB-MM4]
MTAAQRPTHFLELLNTGSWFQGLPEGLKTSLIQMSVIRPLASGEHLFERGDQPDGIYAVVQGALRVTGVREDGKEAILTFVEPPNWFGEIALFDGQLRTHTAIAEGPVTVLNAPQKKLIQLLDQHPQYWRDFGLLLCNKLRFAFLALEDNALFTASERLVRRLLMMSEGYGEWTGKSRRVISLHQEQLGMMLGISRQTTNQILRNLESQGIIARAYGEIEILDPVRLRALGFGKDKI